MGASSVGWARIRDGAGTLTRVITYDRAGLGASPPAADDRGVAALTGDLARVIGPEPVVIVGHSLGATIARYLAMARPELVAGLVLIDPIPDRWVLRHAWWAEPFGRFGYWFLAELARSGLIDTLLTLPLFSGITRSSTSPDVPLTPDERAALAAEVRSPLSHRTAGREFSGLLHSRNLLRGLEKSVITVPLTVLSAGQTHPLGAALRRDATAWHARLVATSAQGRHVVVDNGGHSIPRFQPALVVAAIAELLDRIAVRPSPAVDQDLDAVQDPGQAEAQRGILT